jgi:hypothetical protein
MPWSLGWEGGFLPGGVNTAADSSSVSGRVASQSSASSPLARFS